MITTFSCAAPLFHDSDTPSNKSKVSRFGAFDRTSTDVPRSGSEPDFTISFHGLCSSPRSPSSVSSLTVEPSPALDARILSRLAQLQHQFETVLNRLANSFPRQRLRCVFLINNYDLVISVLSVSQWYWYASILLGFHQAKEHMTFSELQHWMLERLIVRPLLLHATTRLRLDLAWSLACKCPICHLITSLGNKRKQ